MAYWDRLRPHTAKKKFSESFQGKFFGIFPLSRENYSWRICADLEFCDSNMLICVTSRLEPDITYIREPLNFRFVSLHDERGQERGIEEYFKSVIYTNLENEWDANEIQRVIDFLSDAARVIHGCRLISVA
jgi:hypothetical protein